VVVAETPPPPLSGGTLLVTRDGQTAFASDPDRDQLYLADLNTEALLATIPLMPGDEPGRVLESPHGLFVVLRGAGAIAKVDLQSRAVVARRKVCPAPRGVAEGHRPLYVACAGGALENLPADTMPEGWRKVIQRVQRDIVWSADQLFVSRFRSAELLVLSAADGSAAQPPRRAPGSVEANRSANLPSAGGPLNVRAADPGVAWRLRPNGSGGVTMLHQEASNGELGMDPGGYNSSGICRGADGAAMSDFPAAGGGRTGGHIMSATLPLDFAQSPDGKLTAIVAAGNRSGFGQSEQRVMYMTADQSDFGGCRSPSQPTPPPPPTPEEDPIEYRQPVGDPTSVAIDGRGRVVVQTREPARLEILSHKGGSILLSNISRVDTGHQVFHLATQSGLACASCHPDGLEDARTWRFAKIGLRRTQNLRGGVLETAPFHWDGDMRDMRHLTTEVFMGRMAGPSLDTQQSDALARWIDRLPAMPALPVASTDSVDRGKALFNDAAVGCASCHSGARLTNNLNMVVGTGVTLQVPSLRGVGWRAPYMHDGCAPSLLDRFEGKCGGDRHGNTAHLGKAQLADLAAYLDTL
jgi:mono/diheme cytochrome c family protein